MPDSERELLLSPAAADGVVVAAADTARLDLDIDIVVAEGLGLELVLVELGLGVRRLDLKSGELFRDWHGGECFRLVDETVLCCCAVGRTC